MRSLPTLVAAERPDLLRLALLPESVRKSFASPDGRKALIELVPKESATPVELMRFVDALRSHDVATAGGLPGVRILVGGQPAANADYRAAIGGALWKVVAAVVGGTFLVLLAGFRSVLVPLKALALNLVTVAAAFGVAVLVFQDGFGARLVGLAAPVDGLFPAVPVIVFCIVFGLSMDYEVFLVSRVAEGVRSGLGDDDAIVDGVARTRGIITSAALVMVVVFGSSALGDFLVIKILGFTLAVAVLLDVTVARVLVGPALLKLAGRWNWWPGIRRRTGLEAERVSRESLDP